MTVDIIGAGIGGLTTAIALEKKGFKPRIYEQAKSLKVIGAGIILASNAMQVYRCLGLDESIKSEGIPLNALNITNEKLQLISKVDLTHFRNKYNLQSIAIHRAKLQQVLLESLKHTELHLDHQLKQLTKQNSGYKLEFENGKSVNSKVVIGADGIHSKVRNALNPGSQIRDMNQVCWRGVTKFDLPKVYRNELNEAWGKGDRFAFVQFSPDEIYWYAVKSFTNGPEEFSKDKLGLYFQKYPTLIQEIIKKTAPETLHTTVMKDLKPIHTWHDAYSCLIGDAAHATTPNMGQGACQSIEDAYVLAESLSMQTAPEAFKSYEKIRMAKAHRVVNQSRQIGTMSHWKNPVAISLRNLVLKSIPQKVTISQLEDLFELDRYSS